MHEAERQAGRAEGSVLLCAATKMNDAEAVREAVAAGVDCCGENRVQELTQKLAEHAYDGAPVHFIGHLQTNKVRQVVGKVALLQSVDRLELLRCVQKEAARLGITQDILLEINIGAEESKSGFTKEEAIAFGDGFNDIEMLEAVGTGVAMGNAKDDISRSIPPCCDLCMVRIFQNPLILFFPAGTHHLIDVLMNPFIESFIDFQHLITESEILLQIRICTVGDDKMFVTDC